MGGGGEHNLDPEILLFNRCVKSAYLSCVKHKGILCFRHSPSYLETCNLERENKPVHYISFYEWLITHVSTVIAISPQGIEKKSWKINVTDSFSLTSC